MGQPKKRELRKSFKVCSCSLEGRRQPHQETRPCKVDNQMTHALRRSNLN
uniref:Uncharacterized protein n=1 Tax=Manihot esculenta TaxID=3983 RepID=A0A2C9VXF1_MANES